MSVLVWDGKTIAADRQVSNQGLKRTCDKLRRLENGEILGFVGSADAAFAMMKWYEEGRKREDWPKGQDDKDKWATLVVLKPDRRLFYFEQESEPIECLDEQMAWGSGRDFALGAMAMGADARAAVTIASTYSTDCGMGVQAFDLEEPLSLVRSGD